MSDEPQTPATEPVVEAPKVETPVDSIEAKRANAKQVRLVLMNFLTALDSAYMNNEVLLTKGHGQGDDMYVMTAFVIDKGVVSAKIGNLPYQPIGKEDGEGFYPSLDAKLLWMRDFAMAPLLHIKPPFEVRPREAVASGDEAKLSDAERASFEEAFKDISAELQAYSNLAQSKPMIPGKDGQPAAEDPDVAAQSFRLRHTIKYFLVRPACKKIDDAMMALAKTNPHLNSTPEALDLMNVPIGQLAMSVTEFIRMKLNDDGMARFHEQHELALVQTTVTEKSLLERNITRLSEQLPVEGQPVPDPLIVKHLVKNTMGTYPGLEKELGELTETTDFFGALQVTITYLKKLLDGLTPVAEPASAAENPTETPAVSPE